MKFQKKMDSPMDFLKIIPKNLQENLSFRMDLQEKLVKDEGMQKVFLEMCLLEPEIFFNAVAWTFNPRLPAGYRNRPFILRDHQSKAIKTLKSGIDDGRHLVINKSRDEGATELTCKLFAMYWLLVPETMFLVGSRKEEYVDRGTEIAVGRVGGDHKCLFHKILYTIAHLPAWMTPQFKKTYMHFENVENSAVIDGESTNENFGAGDRRTAILLDEFGRVDYNIAKDIRDTINDTTDCVIYSSTHFYGAGHPFNKVVKNPNIETIRLPWYENPTKNQGLYKSPEINQIEIVDIDYYRSICPEVFNDIPANKPFSYSKLEQLSLTLPEKIQEKLKDIKFIADGCEGIPGDLRAPWHDQRELISTARDLAQNVWMHPSGASDMYFDSFVNDRIHAQYVSKATCQTGEIKYNYNQEGKIGKVKFTPNNGKNRMKWYGELLGGRPHQGHNYVIGCDISLGTGASNSVASIVDVNESKLVGVWACPDITPENFADTVMAIAKWVGGVTLPYLIWENNGGHGINFGRRIVQFHRHRLVYTMTIEDTKTRKRRNKWGWNSNRERKDDLLTTLKIALSESLKTKPEHRYIIVPDKDTMDELEDYVFYESGDIGATSVADQSSGARTRHGDRVIALALCMLGLKEQRKAVHREVTRIRPGSMAWRMREHKREEEKLDNDSPWLV